MIEHMWSKSFLPELLRKAAKRWYAVRSQFLRRTAALVKVFVDEVFGTPLEPILHPSPWRLKWLGLFTLIGHPIFGVLWCYIYPQPYDSMPLRLFAGAMGVPLITNKLSRDLDSKLTQQATTLILWVTLPLLFFFMFFQNSGSTLWWISCCCMVLIYYHLTDWRIATIGTTTGLVAAWLIHYTNAGQADTKLTGDINQFGIVFGFAWFSALLLGASSANLRREHVRHTLSTIGIMAHELRTPLATVAMIGDVLQAESGNIASQKSPNDSSLKIDRMGSRLHALSRQMHHQIDTQIANARLMQLPIHDERVSAYEVLNDVIGRYPYRSPKEREIVELHIQTDFIFLSSFALFSQVVDNLMKNSFRALQATDRSLQPGDLRIEVNVAEGKGIISVMDRGRGILPHLLPRVFEPFFSTSRGTGHGLGLAFCEKVIKGAKGEISANSQWMKGTCISITLPVSNRVASIRSASREKLLQA